MNNGISSPLIENGNSQENSSHGSQKANSPAKKKLGTFLGVIMPTMGSLFGVVIFLRIGWATGYAGIYGTIGIFAIAAFVATLTAFSVAAISTNGSMKGGGVYYMISRSLGPEFGGCVGIVFYIGQTVGVAFYATAFADVLIDVFMPDSDAWNDRVLYSSIVLIAMTITALSGAGFFAKFTTGILTVVGFSLVSLLLSLFMKDIATRPDWYTGPSSETYNENAKTHFDATDGVGGSEGGDAGTEKQTFWTVFSVVFPSCTGFIAGANLSGDLKDPSRSIGLGTIVALYSALTVYVTLVFAWGFCVQDSKLRGDLFVSIDVAYNKFAVAIGIWAATSMSGLGHLVGASKILQALARDKLLPILDVFGYGSPLAGNPQLAVLLTFAIAQCLVLIGNLNTIAGIITNFYLLTYFFTNLACFVLKITGAPNFRPLFKYFSWHSAFVGAVTSIVLMFLAEPLYAGISIIASIIIFFFIMYQSPVTSWGDVRQALIYHQVRKYLLRLDSRRDHPKFWRPAILLLLDESRLACPLSLIDFCNNLKKGGLFVIGDVLIGKTADHYKDLDRIQRKYMEVLDALSPGGVKAFSEVGLSSNWLDGARNLVSCGIGGMRPNTVCLSIRDDVKGKSQRELNCSVKEFDAGFRSRAGFGENLMKMLSNVSALPSSYRHTIITRGTDVEVAGSTNSDSGGYFVSFATKQACSTFDEIDRIKTAGRRSLSIDLIDEKHNDSIDHHDVDLFEIISDCLRLKKNVICCCGFDWGRNSRQDIHRKFVANDRNRINLDVYVNMMELKSNLPSGLYSTAVDYVVRRNQTADGTTAAEVMSDEYDDCLDDPAVAPLVDINPSISLQLQLGHVLRLGDTWNECTQMRIIILVQQSEAMSDAAENIRRQMTRLLSLIRIDAQLMMLPVPPPSSSSSSSSVVQGVLPQIFQLHEVIKQNSLPDKTCLVSAILPRIAAATTNPAEYMRNLNYLAQDLSVGVIISYPWVLTEFHFGREDEHLTNNIVTTTL